MIAGLPKGRNIDLSYAAAKEIALIGSGLAEVKIVAFGKKVGRLKSKEGSKPLLELKNLENGEFTIQVGAFRDRKNSLRLSERPKIIFKYVHISVFEDENRRLLHRVHVPKSKTLTLAWKNKKRLEDMSFRGPLL